MNRFAYNQLKHWYDSGSRSLLLGGVEGVGKRDLILNFATHNFKNYYFVTQSEDNLSSTLKNAEENSLLIVEDIKGDKELLITIIDEINKFPNIYIVIIDSYAKEGRGSDRLIKIQYLIIYPLSFEEFLFNVDRTLFTQLSNQLYSNIELELHNNLSNLFYDFLIVGGMPEVISIYIEHGMDFDLIRSKQIEILNRIFTNLKDFYKTTEFKNLQKIIDLILPTISKENRKFKLSDISPSKRYVSYKKYFYMLENLNLIYKSESLKGSDLVPQEKVFTIYFFDTGLLGALGEYPIQNYNKSILLSNNNSLAILINFCACELFSTSRSQITFWTQNMSKIEFVLKNNGLVLPIELKDDSSGKLKSLDTFSKLYKGVKLTRVNLDRPGNRGNVTTFPLYLIKNLYRKFLN